MSKGAVKAFSEGSLKYLFFVYNLSPSPSIAIICEPRIPLSRACYAGSDFNSPIGMHLGIIPGSRQNLETKIYGAHRPHRRAQPVPSRKCSPNPFN